MKLFWLQKKQKKQSNSHNTERKRYIQVQYVQWMEMYIENCNGETDPIEWIASGLSCCICIARHHRNYLNTFYHIHTVCMRISYGKVNYEMPEEFNETLILLGKLVGLKSLSKTIHFGVSGQIERESQAKITKSGKQQNCVCHFLLFLFFILHLAFFLRTNAHAVGVGAEIDWYMPLICCFFGL